MNKNSVIFVSGHRGMVGTSLLKTLRDRGFNNVLTKSKNELNLISQKDTFDFFKSNKIEYVFHCAAKVGGLHAATKYPAEFLYQNAVMTSNVLQAAHENNVQKLVYMGSGCVYPKNPPQPMKEEYILTGLLEETYDAVSMSKIYGIKLCEMYQRQYQRNFISVIGANLFGPNDNFDPEFSHVIPGLLKKFHDAKIQELSQVSVWGTGNAERDFLYIDDFTDALIFLMDKYNDKKPINITYSEPTTIRSLTLTVKEIVGFTGEVVFDTSKPDGMPKKILDGTKIKNLNWNKHTKLIDGIKKAYEWFLKNKSHSN